MILNIIPILNKGNSYLKVILLSPSDNLTPIKLFKYLNDDISLPLL